MKKPVASLLVVLTLVLACGQKPTPVPTPGVLKAGLATVKLDSPVGVPLGGYGRHKSASDPGSPYADHLPASRGVQTQPTARAVALSDGLTTTVVVRTDLCLTTATLRLRAEQLVHETNPDASLLVTSTHTHAAPARYFHPALIDGTAGTDTTALAMDVFLVEQEERLAHSIADAALKAIADLRPAAMGTATADLGNFNNDRRCENDDLYGPNFKDGELTVIRLDEVDASGAPVKPITAFLHYAMHGTVLGSENSLMSTEAPGALELYASDAVGVPLVYLQSSAGDVSPRSGGTNLDDFQALEHLGRTAAPLILDAWTRAAPSPAPAQAHLQRFELPVDLSRAAIGYAQGEFAEFGGIGCGLGGGTCPPTVSTKQDLICIPLARRPFVQTSVVALRLEDVLLVSLPGEPTTAIGARIKQLGAGVSGVTRTMVVGYAQDHFGYILEEPDYLRLGYEPSVSPWGWRWGDFLVGKGVEAVAALGTKQPTLTQPPATPLTQRQANDSTRPAAQVDSVADLERLQTAVFRFAGGDPGLGTPDVALEQEVNGAFVPVMASPSRAVVNGPELVLREDATPTFVTDATATQRDFVWTVEWETLPDTATGRYRLVAKGRTSIAGTPSSFTVTSNTFTVTPSRAVVAGDATVDASGALSVTARFPPNPSLRNAVGETVGNYRLRSLDGDPSVGIATSGGTVTALVTSPDLSTATVTLTWSNGAWRGQVKALAGTTRVSVAVDGLVDGVGNTNGATLELAATR